MQDDEQIIQEGMRLKCGMTIEELLDKSRSMGELNCRNYDRWVSQVLASDREELNQWNILNYHSGCVELPIPVQKEMFGFEKSKNFAGLVDWLFDLQYPVFWDSAAFWLKQSDTLLELLPFVVKAKVEEKKRKFLLWTLVHVWQVRCRNMVMGHENQAGWLQAHKTEYEDGVDHIIAVMGRDAYERLLFRFDCFWANDRLDTFYIIVCEYLARTFKPSDYIHGLCNMNYLNHITRRCGAHFLKDKNLAGYLIEDIMNAVGRMSNSWPSTWEAVGSLIYDTTIPVYKFANDNLEKAIEDDLEKVTVAREGWKIKKDWSVQAEQNTREAIWLGMLVWVVIEENREELFHKIVDVVFSQYRLSDKHPQRGSFKLTGLLESIYKKVAEKKKAWLNYLDVKVLSEINDFVFVAVLLSGRDSYKPDVIQSIKDRWEAEKDVLKLKLKGKDIWKDILCWMQYEVR